MQYNIRKYLIKVIPESSISLFSNSANENLTRTCKRAVVYKGMLNMHSSAVGFLESSFFSSRYGEEIFRRPWHFLHGDEGAHQ